MLSSLAACPSDTHLFITAPTEMEALSGSCLQIPCNFSTVGKDEFDSRRPVFGVWIKNHSDVFAQPNNVIFNSSGTVNIYPMKITGNLKEKNCTTLFSSLNTTYTNTYYLRIMNWPYRSTAVCDPLKITIKDSPWRPNITIPGDLKEKESVTITCSALTPCPHSPPQLTWNLTQDSHNKIEENTDGSFTTKIQQTITLSDTHDGKKISCSARYPVNQGKDTKTAETEETLSVSYAPKETSASISPSGLVSAGSWVKLTCSSRAKPPVSSFTWFKKSRDGAVKVSEGEIYSFNVTDGGVYYCVATNDLGNQTSAEMNLTLTYCEDDYHSLLQKIAVLETKIHRLEVNVEAEINEELSHKEEQTVLREQTKPSRNLEEELHLPPPGKSLRKERCLRQEEGSLFVSNSLNNTIDQDQGPRPSPVPQTPDRPSPSSPSLSPSSPHLKFTEEMMERVNAGLRSTPGPIPFVPINPHQSSQRFAIEPRPQQSNRSYIAQPCPP
ncbi:B-cell receptor CD22-like [Oreochromis aureus]|uniref:B-cell receptor CD22-like n=1 Tax=Oreochromis aureus TaxID=47969 RepID=UPI001953C5B4|nr:B-cell receptor CD22-like [Oreochromis aureus]